LAIINAHLNFFFIDKIKQDLNLEQNYQLLEMYHEEGQFEYKGF